MEHLPEPPDPGAKFRNTTAIWGRQTCSCTSMRRPAGGKCVSLPLLSDAAEPPLVHGRDVFALMRIRGIESGSSTGYAEAFFCRKAIVGMAHLFDVSLPGHGIRSDDIMRQEPMSHHFLVSSSRHSIEATSFRLPCGRYWRKRAAISKSSCRTTTRPTTPHTWPRSSPIRA